MISLLLHINDMKFTVWLEEREKGKSLVELGHLSRYVVIYRAANEQVFKSMDYVTLSRKFAKEHADHQAAVEEEPWLVLKAMVSTDQVFEAYNPGEYFYDGPTIPGKVIYTAQP